MSFVQGKCENCGGILAVDSSLKAANCPFCGAAYVVQDSINYYNTSIKVDNMHADVVNITDESSSEARLKAGAAYIKIGKYDLAEKEYLFVTKMAPQNHLGWLGLIEARTNNYTKRIKSAKELKLLDDYSRSVLTLAPNGLGNNLIEKWKSYLKLEEERNATEKEKITIELSENEKTLNELVVESNSISIQITKCRSSMNSISRIDPPYTKAPVVTWIWGILQTIVGISILPLSVSNNDSFGIMFFVVMILIGVFLIVVAFLITRKRVKDGNEFQHLKDEINILDSKLTEIKRKKEDAQLVVESIRRRISVYI